MKLLLSLLLISLLPFSQKVNTNVSGSAIQKCAPSFNVINNTGVTIQEIRIVGEAETCYFTNIQANSTTDYCSGIPLDYYYLCIKVLNVPQGGGYLKVWSGSTLISCMHVTTGSNFLVCSNDDFQVFCGGYTIEFTTAAC